MANMSIVDKTAKSINAYNVNEDETERETNCEMM